MSKMGFSKKVFSKSKSSIEEQDCYYNDNMWDSDVMQAQAKSQFAAPSHATLIPTDESKKINVKLPLSEWNRLLTDKQKTSVQAFSIEKANYVGFAQSHSTELLCEFDILVFASDQKITLLPASIALKSSTVLYSDQISNNNPSHVDQLSCIGVEQNAYKFFAEAPGRYLVKLEVLVNYLTAKKNGFGFASPKATFNKLAISVPKDVQIKIDPVSEQGQKEEKSIENGVTITKSVANVPPASYIKIQWTDFESGEAVQASVSEGATVSPTSAALPPKQAEQTKVTVQQYTMCSIGEGVVVINNSMKYSVISGQISSFEIILGNHLNVLSVEGYDIKKWECFPIAPLIDIPGSKTAVTEKLLKIILNSPVEDHYLFNIISEIEMESTSGEITIPSVRCRGSEISREKGFLVCESTANVEVEHIARDGLTMIDKTEVPEALARMASGPLLLSYKFLDPKYRLQIKITKHSDLPVLVAICEKAHYLATLSSEGSLLKKLIFSIRNTQQQYIRVTIPHQFEIWSTIVDSKAVKPALDENGTVMIPLNKSSGTERGIQKPFQVVIVYKHTEDLELHNSGTVALKFPSIDIPISHLYISLFLPKDYSYDKCTGNIKEVSYLYGAPSDEDGTSGVRQLSSARGRARAPQEQMQMQMQVQYNTMSNANPMYSQNDERGVNPLYDGMTPGGGEDSKDTAGLKPVIVNFPKTGVRICLEQLLVISTEISIQTKYKEKRGCC
ncbi:hypothetical protein SAMD00019534_106860 [Acytostelium subglobosum LB1]|uniref:hypothetical protein n=1 Tax=Acytostelium subglobosum LB1 TaxID=1410327 RepID=UPI000644C46E|nr:hypothetical protein SAMD00019534_106860 [Acytostelium subglobosum LB1]GAM27510.1 hypothetical protein SAMD00019534_106860 [Acytostelium subglobosum LB1]|eukprot:XP_012749575.1 hypothetical protein SAMD00019534_106860 [Acytostelium subglobosum LB1]